VRKTREKRKGGWREGTREKKEKGQKENTPGEEGKPLR
jgi:hypothetical protein